MSNLASIITTIEERSGALEAAYTASEKHLYERLTVRESGYRVLMDDLARDYCAKYNAGNTHVLTLSGIRVSCTSGINGLVHAWLRKARVKAGQELAGAA